MSYSVPGGNSLGEVLGLQHADAPGIATKQNPDGSWELTAWPAALGSVPTQAQVNQWAANVASNRRAMKNANVKASLRANDEATVKLRAALKVVMASLVEVRTQVGLPNRTWAQVLAAVDAIIDAGQGEE